MVKKSLSIRIEEKLLNALNGLIPNKEATTTYKVETLLKMNMLNYNKALKSLIGKFSYLEVCYMAQTFNGTMIQRDIMDTAEYLYTQVNDFYIFGSMGFISGEEVDVDSLLNKLENLTDYQALAVINSIEEFWNNSDKDIRDLLIVEKELVRE